MMGIRRRFTILRRTLRDKTPGRGRLRIDLNFMDPPPASLGSGIYTNVGSDFGGWMRERGESR